MSNISKLLSKNELYSPIIFHSSSIAEDLKIDVYLVGGFVRDLLLNKNVSIIIMHMQNNPEKMQENPSYEFPIIDIYEFFKAKIKFLLNNGVKKSQIIIDPGFGFGKNKESKNKNNSNNYHALSKLDLKVLLREINESFNSFLKSAESAIAPSFK